jgi:hypothetical protein
MSDERGKPAALAYTATVLLAGAVAHADERWMRRYAQRSYEFSLLAAANQESSVLPEQGWYDMRHVLRVEPVTAHGELGLTFQAVGYAALVSVAGRGGRVRTSDGAVDRPLKFDGDGLASVTLEDSVATRRALSRFHVILDDADAATVPGAPCQAP